MRAAILLCGCGAKDGSEIHESVFSICALQEASFETQIFAIDAPQREVVNHLNGKKETKTRNMLIEAARIARGKILPLTELKVADFAALVLPGGFGSAKNLCDYALKGRQMEVRKEAHELITSFYEQKKAIGAICVAPMIVGKVLGKHGITLTLGEDEEAARDLESFGAKHQSCAKGESICDTIHRIASTPAYMYADATLPEVFQGIRKMAFNLKELAVKG